MKTNRKTMLACLVAVSLGALISTSRAQSFTETTDAGQSIATAAQTSSAAATLAAIYGTFGSGGSDADLYAITINTPSAFSASTDNATTNGAFLDTTLSLFDASGAPLATNDDTGSGFASTLPVGNALYANLAAGTYYLGVSPGGSLPVNSASQNLFNPPTDGDPTSVRGPATGLAPAVESDYTTTAAPQTGSYEIDLTGAGPISIVPEPSAAATLALGGLAIGVFLLRRRFCSVTHP